MTIETSEQAGLNDKEPDGCRKSLAIAEILFPEEEWIPKEANIWLAKSRLIEEFREPDKWMREMSQVRILTGRGSVAVFLPERKNEGKGKVYVDAVIDGEIVELKTVAGNRNTLGTAFKQGFRQGMAVVQDYPEIQTHSVFVRLLSDFTVGSVKAKIAGELKNRTENGYFICFFEQTGELHTWSYKELRTIIRK
jgi:hypothetical protein